MLIQPTMDKLRQMRLYGMAAALEEQLENSEYKKFSLMTGWAFSLTGNGHTGRKSALQPGSERPGSGKRQPWKPWTYQNKGGWTGARFCTLPSRNGLITT